MNDITKETVEAYVAGGGIGCPVCRSRDTEGGPVEIDAGRAYQRLTCLACGACWQDGYTLDSVAADDGEPFVRRSIRILVEVSGGLVTAVYCSDADAEVELVDYDSAEDKRAAERRTKATIRRHGLKAVF